MLDKKDILIKEGESVKAALKRLDKTAEKILLVVGDENKLLGTLSDGDVRRFLLKGGDLGDDIKGLYNGSPICLREGEFSEETLKRTFLENKIEGIPLVDKDYKITDFLVWSRIFSDKSFTEKDRQPLNVPVVIMAGGKSTRLEPFSKIFPKALMPIGDQPIVEVIIEEFRSQGVDEYYLTLNYKSGIIEAFFNDMERDYTIKYVKEEKFLGTAGSLKLLEDDIADLFIVSNCDVIVKADFEEVVKLHREKGASMTILSSIQHHQIPYGVIKFKEEGEVTEISEKPEYTFAVNTGVYVLNKELLDLIPEDIPFDMTDLIKNAIEVNKKIITYPVNESDYTDIGQWEEYKKTLGKMGMLK